MGSVIYSIAKGVKDGTLITIPEAINEGVRHAVGLAFKDDAYSTGFAIARAVGGTVDRNDLPL